MKKEKQWIIIIAVLLVISLVSGGASAILLVGLAFDIIYAIHKISSVIFAVLLVIFFVRQRKD
ncbi:MAG: hypothetical protein P8Y23_06445 [Candidatus Lokiarchaeota archaeon]|jgi:hypothetical protein